MVSNVNTGSTARHASLSKIVITVQTLVILSLSSWIVEEYLNNMYLREYVNGVFQADGLVFGVLGTLLVLGSVSGLIFVKRRHGDKRFGAVSLEITPPRPSFKVATPASPKPVEASTRPVEPSAKPSMDFHPVVAALKADMADRRLSFGSIVGSGTEQLAKVPAPSVEVQKVSVLDQLTPKLQGPATGPRPMQMGPPPFPQRPSTELRPPGPAGPRPEQVAGSLSQRPMPVLRTQEPAGSSVLQPPKPPAPQIPTNVTTVITGIMPLKKKDPPATTEEKSSSSQ